MVSFYCFYLQIDVIVIGMNFQVFLNCVDGITLVALTEDNALWRLILFS
jgi:hypothetical protein